jgi:large subunit ribosomal protein L5
MADDDKKKKKGGEELGVDEAAAAAAKEKKAKREAAAAEGKARAKREKESQGGLTREASPDDPPPRTGKPRLQLQYEKDVVPQLMKEFSYKNRMQVPRMKKITLNMGLGEAISNPKVMDSAVEEMRAIAGQKPVVTKAKKSIATFKLREGQKIGCMVTLRKEKMFEFFDRLVSLALPRVRDFKGISPRAFDGRGNFSLGIKEQIIFPEINYDRIDKIKGLNVSIVTTARTDEEGRALLRHLGMPFRS